MTRMKVFLILAILGFLLGFGTLLKLLAFSIFAILGLPLVSLGFLLLLYLAFK